jgi:hypothetical protein
MLFEILKASLNEPREIHTFLTGVRQRGVQTTEEMLKEGTFITGIGEITLEKDGLKLQPPSDGNPYYLTVLPIASLIRKLDDQKRIYRYGNSINLAYFQCNQCLLIFLLSDNFHFLYQIKVMFSEVIFTQKRGRKPHRKSLTLFLGNTIFLSQCNNH